MKTVSLMWEVVSVITRCVRNDVNLMKYIYFFQQEILTALVHAMVVFPTVQVVVAAAVATVVVIITTPPPLLGVH